MFPLWRLKLREARLAYESGRYDEAGGLLQSQEVRDFLPAKQLARKVAAKFVERADGRLIRGESSAGWNDLSTARQLGGQDESISRLRQQYAERTRAEACQYLAAGEPSLALVRLEKLERRGLSGKMDRAYKQLATLMCQVEQGTARGHFAEAQAAADKANLLAERIDPEDTMGLRKRLTEVTSLLAQRDAECQRLASQMHEALTRQNWGAVLSCADAILAIAPQHTTAQQARRRAWRAVGMNATRAWHPSNSPVNPVSLQYNRPKRPIGGRSTFPGTNSSKSDTVAKFSPPQQMLLWADAVGGYLICFDDEVLIGQPTPETPIAIPILADLSRRHAIIRRSEGGYVLEPLGNVCIDQQRIHGPTVLVDNQTIQLGESVRLRFRKPHALSATARLTIESRHKTQPSADAVLLMAESCVLGSSPHCHIQCSDWTHDVILFRHADGLRCRSTGAITVDGQPVSGPAEVGAGSRIEGDDFALSLEGPEGTDA